MANLRGQGAFKDVSLIVRANPKSVAKDQNGAIKGRYLEVQVDQSLKNPDKVLSGEIEVDSNPFLTSRAASFEGNNYVDHTVYYSESQYQKMVEAAGKKHTTTDKGHDLFGIRADLRKNADGQLIVATDKEMNPTKNPKFGKSTWEKQMAVTAAAKTVKEQQKQAKQAEMQAEAQSEATAEVKEPEMG